MKVNYFTVHKNKEPKKAKYSKPYSSDELKQMDIYIEYFKERIKKTRESINVLTIIKTK